MFMRYKSDEVPVKRTHTKGTALHSATLSKPRFTHQCAAANAFSSFS